MPAPGLLLYESPQVAELALDFDPSVRPRVQGAGGGEGVAARMAMNESLSLPGLEIDGAPILVVPPPADFVGYHEGVIGHSLFERFVVELDFDRGVMRLLEPETYQPAPEAHALPLTLRHRVPYTAVHVTPRDGEPFETEVVVDLGASHAISLNTGASDAIRIPTPSIETILGRGFSGPIHGRVGRLEALQLGGARLEDVVASFPVAEHQNPRGIDSLGGNLGSDALRRFETTFDYSRRRLFLRPGAAFGEPFRFDRSGLRLGMGRELCVELVLPDSPAAAAGIEIGDVLTHIDDAAVTGADYGTVRETLAGDGEVHLSLRRGDRPYERTLRLKRLL
jgi:hypothetical protein